MGLKDHRTTDYKTTRPLGLAAFLLVLWSVVSGQWSVSAQVSRQVPFFNRRAVTATNLPPMNDLVLWARPESLATNAAGSKIANPSAVARWDDSSGKNNHITNSVTSDQATLLVADFAGRFNAARFDGTTNSMFVPQINLGTNWTLATIYKEPVDAFSYKPLFWNSNTLMAAVSDSANGIMQTFDGAAFVVSKGGYYTTGYHAAVWISSNGVVRQYYNGTDITETSQPTLTNNQIVSVVGAKADGENVNAATPQFVEILMWTNALSGVLRTNLDNYITAPGRYPFTFYTNTTAGEIVAASGSLADVQAAVDDAADGDTVLIPDDTETWTGGITTTKQIIIRAQNYTPTPAGTEGSGATTRSVTITHNAGSAQLFNFTTGNSFHCGLGGVRFNEGTGTGNFVRFSGTGTKVGKLFDVFMQCKQRNGSATDVAIIAWLATGGIIWNIVVSADGFTGPVGTSPFGVEGASLLVESDRAWESASTMGTLDTGGIINLYVEDSTFLNVGQCPDAEDQARMVLRHCLFDGTWGLTHGFTGLWGGRHVEYYDNVFSVTHNAAPYRAVANRYVWNRAGTMVFTDNECNTPANTSEWGNVSQLNIGDNTAPTSYPQDRQPGYGHNGSANVSDPIYIWNQTGGRAYTWSHNNSAGDWASMVVLDRDLFVNSGAKPSTSGSPGAYAKYTYPHPLR